MSKVHNLENPFVTMVLSQLLKIKSADTCMLTVVKPHCISYFFTYILLYSGSGINGKALLSVAGGSINLTSVNTNFAIRC